MSKNIEVLLRANETTELFESIGNPQGRPEARLPPLCPDPVGSAEEAELVQRVFMLPAHESPRVVAFCGVGQAKGAGGICTRAAQNLANQTGSSVCVVEGSLQTPSLHRYFHLNNSRGLTDALVESGPIRDFVRHIPGMRVSVLPGGSLCGKARALWRSDRLRQRIAELRQEFSYVLICGPQATEEHMDAVLLGRVADGVILILESTVTRREAARAAKENFDAAKVKILGAVLDNYTFAIPETLYRRL